MDTHYKAAQEVARILNTYGHEAYIIGGAVRDLLLGAHPKDYDLVTNATPEQLLAMPELADPKHTDPAQAFGVTRTKVDIGGEQIPIEVTTYRKDIEAHLGRSKTKIEFADLAEDTRRRDFTINALALDPLRNCLVDLVSGLDDLDNKIVRFICEPNQRIQEDPLRVIRAIRIKNQLGFTYHSDTFDAITQAVANGAITDIATDRLRDELTRMFTHESRLESLQDLDTFGVLKILLPELEATKNVPQPEQYHAEGDVFKHSLLALSYLPKIVSGRLAWATLLHDIGKAPTYQPAEITGDRIRFNHHFSEGAKQAEDLLKRLNFSKRTIEDITWMIHYHLAIAQLPDMRPGHAATFMNNPAFEDLLELHRADAHAAWTQSEGVVDTSAPDLSHLEHMYADHKKNQAKPTKTLKSELQIDGNWLQQHFPNLSPEQIGDVLSELKQLFHENKIASTEDAKTKVEALLTK